MPRVDAALNGHTHNTTQPNKIKRLRDTEGLPFAIYTVCPVTWTDAGHSSEQ